MLKVKGFLIGGSLLGTFLLVYGTAILFRLLIGSYFMSEGLADPNYIYLTLLCAAPFVVGSLIPMNKNAKKHIEMMFIGGLLFSILFMTVHGVLVFSEAEMIDGVIGRTLILLPISALLVVFSTYVGMNMGKPARGNLG